MLLSYVTYFSDKSSAFHKWRHQLHWNNSLPLHSLNDTVLFDLLETKETVFHVPEKRLLFHIASGEKKRKLKKNTANT